MSLPDKLSSLSSSGDHGGGGTDQNSDSSTSSSALSERNLVQRCVIIQKDERGYGLTVSGDRPVYVASVKPEGAAAKAGVQKDDRIVKVNGTLVSNSTHIEVVRLIKTGSYVALTLMGKPNPPGVNQSSVSSPPPEVNNSTSNRTSRITAPLPVDADKDRELVQQKVHMTQVMLEQAREDYEHNQRQYVKVPSEALYNQLLDKQRTIKTLENQLKTLTAADDSTPTQTPPSTTSLHPISDVDHNFTDSAPLNSWATSLPVCDPDMSDSPRTSPSISPTPTHPNNGRPDREDHSAPTRSHAGTEQDSVPAQTDIIIIDDEDVNSDEEQPMEGQRWSDHSPPSPFLTKLQSAEGVDTGPFSDIRLLEKKPAHMAVLLHYLISNSDPCNLFFYIITDMYKQTAGNSKDLRKWGYEIFSTFLVPNAPLQVDTGENLVEQVSEVLAAGSSRSENESQLRSMFDACRVALGPELSEQLADFRNKKDMGLGTIFGTHELREDMDRSTEQKTIEKYLLPHLQHCTETESKSARRLSDRDQAMGWALATFFRQQGITKTTGGSGGGGGSSLDRVQSFIMKDKKGMLKLPRAAKAKIMVKGHQFNMQHFYVPTLCSKCEGLIWGVGYQGFLCQICEMSVHKQCVEDVTETCSGKKRSKRLSSNITARIKSGAPAGGVGYSVVEGLGQAFTGDNRTSTVSEPLTSVTTQPLREEDKELAGLTTEQTVKNIVREMELASPTGDGQPAQAPDKTGSTDLARSESLKGKGDRGERPTRRAKSDVDREDMEQALNQQSASSSASSLSNRSVESPSNSSEYVNDSTTSRSRTQQYDSDLEVEVELPPLKQVLGEDVVKKLKPKEKKRQEVVNELLHTERAHLRNLKVLDVLFNRPMQAEGGVIAELAHALFPNIDEIITLHAAMNKTMKERRAQNVVVGDLGDILLDRFDGEAGERFRKACAEYCRNQSFALDHLKRLRRKDQRLTQFLADTEMDKLCRKLELKDLVPCQMQRLTKYPLLIENLMKYTQTSSEEHRSLQRSLELSRQILAFVNLSVRECENHHKLRDMQKKLDTRSIDSSADPSLKKLDLTQHRLVHDGPLVWRLRSRQLELQALLLEDILVFLQRADERLVLKCQSNNQQGSSSDSKTHSPVLKLQNLLARNVATDRKAFFVINTSSQGPQIYELVAPTQDARKTWCRLINEKAEEQKKLVTQSQSATRVQNVTHMQTVTHTQKPVVAPCQEQDEFTMVRNQIMRKSQEQSPPPSDAGQAAAPAEAPTNQDGDDNLGSQATSDVQPELVQPDQVSVSGAVTAQAQPVLSPLERLRRNDQVITQALSEKEEIVAEMLQLNPSEYQRLAQQGQTISGGQQGQTISGGREEECDEQVLLLSCVDSNNRLIQLISAQASALALDSQQQTSDSGSGSGSSAQSTFIPPESESSTGPSQLRQQQEQLAQGASGQNVNIPMPVHQLQAMASNMNNILSSLMRVVQTKGEERRSLRSQLETAQEQLDMLRSIQQQILSQQPPLTPHSRPLSFASSISETGEATTDGEQTEDGDGETVTESSSQLIVVDTAQPPHQSDNALSVLNLAHTQELSQETDDGAEEVVEQLPSDLQPQVVRVAPLSTTQQDEDSDEGFDVNAEKLPLPDDDRVAQGRSLASPHEKEEEEEGREERGEVWSQPPDSQEPMTTDLDEGEDDGRSTPTPSPTMTLTSEGGEREGEEEEDRDSVTTVSETRPLTFGQEGQSWGKGENADQGGDNSRLREVAEDADENDNDDDDSSSQDSELHPIEI